MAAKKPMWQLAVIDRMLKAQLAAIVELEGRSKSVPASASCRKCWNDLLPGGHEANPRCEYCGGAGIPYDRDHELRKIHKALDSARQHADKLRAMKRQPADLLALEDLLRNRELVEKLKRRPKGSEALLAALLSEQLRFENKFGTLDRYFAFKDAQRKNSREARVIFDEHDLTPLRNLVATLERNNPGAKPRELWPQFYGIVEQQVGDNNCRSVGTVKKPVYEYRFQGRRWRKISYKHFGDLVRDSRKRRAAETD